MQRCLARLPASLLSLPSSLPFSLPLSSHVNAPLRFCVRGLVSPAFQCQEEWSNRLSHEIFDNLKSSDGRFVQAPLVCLSLLIFRLGELFVEMDRKFTMEMGGSALDVDIFAQAAEGEADLEQLEELLFKLRRTPHTVHMTASTQHAAVRAMIGKGAGEEHLQHLLRMLEDHTNYGLFLDKYTAVLLLDKLVEEGRRPEGARVASQLMLQVDKSYFSKDTSVINQAVSNFQEEDWVSAGALGNVACWRYLLVRSDQPWAEEDVLEEEEDPEDVVRVRVKEGPPHFGMVPNNYNDDHFDLREPEMILGKTIWYLNRLNSDSLSKSLTFLGLALWGKIDQALELDLPEVIGGVAEEILKVSDKDAVVKKLNTANTVDLDVDNELLKKCERSLSEEEKVIVEEQKAFYIQWNKERLARLEAANENQKRKEKLDNILYEKEQLSREEERLFFFDNQMELDQEKEKKVAAWKRTFPRRSWPGTKDYFKHPKWHKTPGREIKTARWEKREAKKGPAK